MPATSSLSLSRHVPARALAISAGAFAVPVVASIVLPDSYRAYTLLLWLLAIVPAFLLAYHRGWQGAALALAAGMALLSTSQAFLLFLGREVEDRIVLLALTGFFTATSLGIGLVTELLHRAREQVAELALTDELTGLPNQRYARLFLEKEFEAALRGRPLTLVLFDLDRLGQYNHTHGHAGGDQALQAFAQALASNTRAMNVSARFSGGRFISVLGSSDKEGALSCAERVRDAFRSSQPRHGTMTVSAGLAACDGGMTSVNELLAAAEYALFLAKAAGRDCIRVADRAGSGEGGR